MTHVHSKLPNHADQHEVDAAVVGGGPGGLAAAAAVLSAFGDTLKVKVRLLMFFANNMGVTKTSAPDLAESMRKAPSTLVDWGTSKSYLRWFPHLTQVYESLTEYTLQGSAVGLQPNAQYALEAIHPDLFARRAAAYELSWVLDQQLCASLNIRRHSFAVNSFNKLALTRIHRFACVAQLQHR